MAEYSKDIYLPEPFVTDLLRFRALLLSFIRFAVEKHGGRIERDPISGNAYVDIPDWAEDTCCQELRNLIGPGKTL